MKSNNKESSYTKEDILKTLSRMENKIQSFNFEKRNDSIGMQMGLLADINDLVSAININRILIPDHLIDLKISRRTGWNGRGIKKQI